MNLVAYGLAETLTPKCVVRQISKKFCFGILDQKRHGKLSQTLLKSARQHLYHIY